MGNGQKFALSFFRPGNLLCQIDNSTWTTDLQLCYLHVLSSKTMCIGQMEDLVVDVLLQILGLVAKVLWWNHSSRIRKNAVETPSDQGKPDSVAHTVTSLRKIICAQPFCQMYITYAPDKHINTSSIESWSNELVYSNTCVRNITRNLHWLCMIVYYLEISCTSGRRKK